MQWTSTRAQKAPPDHQHCRTRRTQACTNVKEHSVVAAYCLLLYDAATECRTLLHATCCCTLPVAACCLRPRRSGVAHRGGMRALRAWGSGATGAPLQTHSAFKWLWLTFSYCSQRCRLCTTTSRFPTSVCGLSSYYGSSYADDARKLTVRGTAQILCPT